MLLLYTSFRNLFFITFLLIAFVSCADRSKSELKVIQTLNESIENSNKRLKSSTVDVMSSLQNKIYDYATKERAQIWFPKAQKIQEISKVAFDQIQQIKRKLEKNEMEAFSRTDIVTIYDYLIKYRNHLLLVDEKLTKGYQHYLKIFTKSIDSSQENQLELLNDYFSGVSQHSAIAMLTKFQNNIRLNEEGMVIFCHEHSTPIFCGLRYLPSPIVIQNSTIFQAGEKIEIIAGLGSINVELNPKIFVYDNPIPLAADGAAHYRLKAPSKPGKHYIPVKINYTDQEGRAQSVVKEIEYTVANIQKQ